MTEPKTDPAAAAAATIREAQRATVLTAQGEAGDLPGSIFDRLSVERRVLGHVTDEVNITALGPRNTLAAIVYDLMTDRNTTNPPPGFPRLDVEDRTVEEIAGDVIGYLDRLVEAELLSQGKDGSYALTDAGHAELAS